MEKHTELDVTLKIDDAEVKICFCRENGRYDVSFNHYDRVAEFNVASLNELKDFLNVIIKAFNQVEI